MHLLCVYTNRTLNEVGHYFMDPLLVINGNYLNKQKKWRWRKIRDLPFRPDNERIVAAAAADNDY